MKEIMAVIRNNKWQETKRALLTMGVSSFTTSRAYGRGKQKGLRYETPESNELQGVRYIPKRLVHLWVEDAQARGAVETLIMVNQTGELGDGKIFVMPIKDAMRLRTGEVGEIAL